MDRQTEGHMEGWSGRQVGWYKHQCRKGEGLQIQIYRDTHMVFFQLLQIITFCSKGTDFFDGDGGNAKSAIRRSWCSICNMERTLFYSLYLYFKSFTFLVENKLGFLLPF